MTRNKEYDALMAIIESERQRVDLRDQQLLAQELSLVREPSKLGAISFRSLDAYCSWLSPNQPKTVKWDLLRHYATHENTAYLPVYRENNSVICKPYFKDYDNRLLTHSLSGYYWEQTKSNGYLPGQPRVCFASGQVVFKGAAIDGMFSMTGIFDRKTLDKVYTLLPYSDHEVEWEKEIRAHEPISMDLALAWIPTQEFVLELNHWGQLTCVCGTRIMEKLENDYLQTGVLKGIR